MTLPGFGRGIFVSGDDCTRAQRRDARWPQPAAKNIRYTSRPFSMRSPNAGPAVCHSHGRSSTSRLKRIGTRMVISHFERSEEHTYELKSLMRISYAVFCLKKKT